MLQCVCFVQDKYTLFVLGYTYIKDSVPLSCFCAWQDTNKPLNTVLYVSVIYMTGTVHFIILLLINELFIDLLLIY